MDPTTHAATSSTGSGGPSRGGRRGGRAGSQAGEGGVSKGRNGGRSNGNGNGTGGGRSAGNGNSTGGEVPREGQARTRRSHGKGKAGNRQGNEGNTTVRVGQSAPVLQTASGDNNEASDPDSPVCFICANQVKYTAIPPCNHETCHVCSLRMRALYKSKACAHCRTESDYVIFTKDAEKSFEDFSDSDIYSLKEQFGIKFELQEIEEDTNALLRFNCPDKSCERSCLGWPDLYRHVKVEHNRVMCELCTTNKKVFTTEHELFTPNELRRHERHGDDKPGSESQSGFKGHPDCGFCKQRFYSMDELFAHCREKHERCFICDRNSTSSNVQYYVDYQSVEEHFKRDHFVCPDDECLEKKFVVFENEIDLKAHQLSVHPNGLTKNARRDARRIDMSHFQVAESSRDGGRRRGRGGQDRDNGSGRGRQEIDVPIRTEQNLSRAEIAYHRTQQLGIQSAQSTTSRTFGGQLTEPAFAANPSAAASSRTAPQTLVGEDTVRPVRHVPGNIPAVPININDSTTFPSLSTTPPPVNSVPTAPRPAPATAPRPTPAEAFPALPGARRPTAPASQPKPYRPAPASPGISSNAFPSLNATVRIKPARPSGRPPAPAESSEVSRSDQWPGLGGAGSSRVPTGQWSRPNVAIPPGSNLSKEERDNAAVLDRASKMLGFDQDRIREFRGYVSRYNREQEPDSDGLISNLWRLFKMEKANARQVTEFGTLITELASIYENESKQKKLRQSWNTRKLIIEEDNKAPLRRPTVDYPDLPTSSTKKYPMVNGKNKTPTLNAWSSGNGNTSGASTTQSRSSASSDMEEATSNAKGKGKKVLHFGLKAQV
ncbi:hypothetical protein BZA77DRAFT_157545 [Pyronema omphalodes]|nr:hypothetical protein BZA77DRAFT_157545 [Pyronema omphalodes]